MLPTARPYLSLALSPTMPAPPLSGSLAVGRIICWRKPALNGCNKGQGIGATGSNF